MLTGRRPYEADNAADIVKKHLLEPIPSVRQFNEEIPEGVDDLVRKCLAKRPRDRFQTPTELLRAIDEALEEKESGPGLERFLTGRALGQCRLLEHLGSGGMATVYKAYQPSLDRYVAVKVLPPYLAQTRGFAARFRREARAIARLNHPNILPVYDSGQEGELSYIVMRYVEGGTLQEMLGKPLPLDRVVELITQVGGALDYAHQEGIIHRDVKPSNVLMDKGEWALLSDFGLAKMVETSVKLTETGVGIGTPAYIAPELGKGEPADERSDIYSLGIMLYEMLTGRVPFEAQSPMAVVLDHISTPLPVPRSINPDIPEPVEQVLLKALAKDPADRFQRMGQMVTALQKAVAGEPMVTSIVPLAEEERPPRAETIAEKVERIGVPPMEKAEAPKVGGVSLEALLLRGALIGMLILVLAAIGLVAVWAKDRGRSPWPCTSRPFLRLPALWRSFWALATSGMDAPTCKTIWGSPSLPNRASLMLTSFSPPGATCLNGWTPTRSMSCIPPRIGRCMRMTGRRERMCMTSPLQRKATLLPRDLANSGVRVRRSNQAWTGAAHPGQQTPMGRFNNSSEG